ncbi:fimbrial protein [Stenotrophomonas maltophilia]|uniref:fimbrial protein n=1 Tax=Stenotrophomonas maltophilia TaxID=40324 RepID=UPI0013DA2BCC|nr:fimbrial protein [Stenotrophomonas maltophilia]
MKLRSCSFAAASLLLIGVALPRIALADCFYRPNANLGTKVVNAGTVIVYQSDPVGKVVHSSSFIAGWPEVAHCIAPGGSMTYWNQILWGTPVTGMNGVYATNVPGIGYRVSLAGTFNPWFPGTYTRNFTVPSGQASWGASQRWAVEFALVKTAARVGNGPLDPVPFARADSGAGPSQPYMVLQIGDIRILAPSCQVAVGSRNQTVNLGQEFRNRFRGVGSATASKDFQVVVNCQASPNGIENMVSLTMDATPDASSTPGVLGIDTGTGTATGVGIQVLDSAGQPVAFGQPRQLGQSKDGDYVVPFKARYYQVAGAVGGGQANGRATVTLSYK